MTSLGTYWRTLRHLRAQQIVGRIVFRLNRPRPQLRAAPPRRPVAGRWVDPARREASLHGDRTFTFLGETHPLDRVGWDDPGIARLWRYNLHYFDDLNAIGAAQRAAAHAALVARWIAENPPATGTGWEPYPVSLRIVNWVKASLGGAVLPAGAEHSLAVQARWLTRRLETHLLGNHLFVNAKALVFAGLYFDGPEAARWQQIGMRILERELGEQVLADGGQFERSPMYHALALEDLLDLVNMFDTFGASNLPLRHALAARIPSMLRWLLALTHPDGTLALFNDTAQGIAPSNDELLRYAAALGFEPPARDPGPLLHLADSGYLRVERGAMTAMLDLAPVGPDYLPAHAHADTLSFELSVGSRRIIVNGGTSCYGTSARRLHERSTAAHSTVEIDGQSSSEVWSGFRVGRRAHPGIPRITPGDDACEIACDHDGYAHLPGHPRHERLWRFAADALTLTDRVSDPSHDAVARFHLAPGISLSPAGSNTWVLGADDKTIVRVEVRGGRAHDEASSHAQRFGPVQATRCLAVRLERGSAETRWTWER